MSSSSFDHNSQEPTRHNSHHERQYTQSFPSRTIVHAKLEMTEPGDRDEQEADAVASTIVSGGKISRQISGGSGGSSGIAVSPQMESQLSRLQGGGRQMPDGLRNMMESGFGRDFSQVRLHTDSEAASMSSSIHAKAFTHGNDIFFNRGQFSPDTRGGQHLIAHELTHVTQNSGKVARENEISPGILDFAGETNDPLDVLQDQICYKYDEFFKKIETANKLLGFWEDLPTAVIVASINFIPGAGGGIAAIGGTVIDYVDKDKELKLEAFIDKVKTDVRRNKNQKELEKINAKLATLLKFEAEDFVKIFRLYKEYMGSDFSSNTSSHRSSQNSMFIKNSLGEWFAVRELKLSSHRRTDRFTKIGDDRNALQYALFRYYQQKNSTSVDLSRRLTRKLNNDLISSDFNTRIESLSETLIERKDFNEILPPDEELLDYTQLAELQSVLQSVSSGYKSGTPTMQENRRKLLNDMEIGRPSFVRELDSTERDYSIKKIPYDESVPAQVHCERVLTTYFIHNRLTRGQQIRVLDVLRRLGIIPV